MTKKLLCVLIIMYFFTNCKNDTENWRYNEEQIESLKLNETKKLKINRDSLISINLNPFLKKGYFDFDSLIKEMKIITLETSKHSLLDDIRKVIVTDFNIFIHDDYKGGGIVIFNKEGKFIKRIPNGKGPGELYKLYDISYNETTKQLVAYQSRMLFFYDLSGGFVEAKRLPLGFNKFEATKNGYLFKVIEGDKGINRHFNELKNYTLLAADKNFKLKSVYLESADVKLNFGGRDFLYKNDSSLYATQNYSDTIYNYSEESNRLSAKYVLDFSTKKLPNSFILGSFDAFQKAINKNDYYFYLGEYLDTGTHHRFILQNYYTKNTLTAYRDKATGKIVAGTSIRYNPQEIPPISYPKFTHKNYFGSFYYPDNRNFDDSQIISYEDKSKLKQLTENDNPALVLFKLKHF